MTIARKKIKMIIALARAEYKKEFAGSGLGIFWAIFRPVVTILAYYFVFTALRAQPVDSVPFIIFLAPAVFTWTFLSESFTGGAQSIRANSFLVKKVVFPIQILPLIKVTANVFNQFIYIVITLILLLVYKIPITIHSIQIVYYLAAGFVFITILSTFVACLAVMSIDIIHLLNSIIQILFYATPVIWPIEMTGNLGFIGKILKYQPFTYVVEGVRNSLLQNEWIIFKEFNQFIVFWSITILSYILMRFYFNKTKGEYADVI